MFGLVFLIIVVVAFIFIFIYAKSVISGSAESEKNSVKSQVKTMAMLASDACFATYYNTAGMRFMSMNMGQANSTALAENEGMREARSSRTTDQYEINKKITQDEAKGLIDSWIAQKIRPEHIQSRIAKIFSNYNLSDEKFEKILTPVVKAVVEFDISFSQYLNIRNDWGRRAQEIANQETKNKQAAGLSYGIISNDVSAHVLYSVLNQAEIKKQLAAQDYAISRTQGYQNKAAIEQQYNRVMSLYTEEFANKIYSAVKSAYAEINLGK